MKGISTFIAKRIVGTFTSTFAFRSPTKKKKNTDHLAGKQIKPNDFSSVRN